jgi:N-acetylglucosaminyl-diphospho-decaprenol L-rhamnosyltransferase
VDAVAGELAVDADQAVFVVDVGPGVGRRSRRRLYRSAGYPPCAGRRTTLFQRMEHRSLVRWIERMTDAIVVTYKSADVIVACLQPLVEAGLHVIVVDNAETADAVRRWSPGVELIANDENRGFPAGVNQGLERCRGDVVLLVNPDCQVPVATIEALVAFLETQPDVGVVGPRLLRPDGSVHMSAQPMPGLSTLLLNRLRRSLPATFTRLLARGNRWSSYDACLNATEPTEVAWLSGACMAVRGEFLREVGGLDDGYFMYYEDLELCLQAWERNLRVVYLPVVQAVHQEGGSSGDRSIIWPAHARSTLRFYARHRPREFQVVRLILLGRALIGLALAPAQDRRNPGANRLRAWRSVLAAVLAGSKRAARGGVRSRGPREASGT